MPQFWQKEESVMWLAIAIGGYLVGVFLLIRFFHAVHQWDEDIDTMDRPGYQTTKRWMNHKKAAA